LAPIILKNYHSHLLEKADKARSKKDYVTCARLCESILKKAPNELGALEIWALCALECGKYDEASKLGLQLAEKLPSNPNGAMISSVAFMNTSQDLAAAQILEKQLKHTPQEIGLLFNLHSAYASLGENTKALEIAMSAVALAPTNADAFNNLGASFHSVNRRKDAALSFQTALDLNPDHATARLNLVNTGDLDDATLISETEFIIQKKSKVKVQERILVGALHNAAFAYFRIGKLKQAWEALEQGFSPLIDSNRGRRPQRNFSKPRWTGEPLNGKRLMVWREQGLGDEIMFASMLHELLTVDGQVVLECEPRLVTLLQNSFPQFEVRPEAYHQAFPFNNVHDDFDLQIPIGSLGGIYRNSVEDFSRSGPYIKVESSLQDKYQSRLAQFAGNKIKVGLCWRSGVVSPTRGASYTMLQDWSELFKSPAVCLVNLQYGQCEAELLAIEKDFGIQILRWEDTNLQNDLDALAALISQLDIVCSVGTAVAQMSGAIGIPTLLCANAYGWTSFGTNSYPFFPDIHLLVDEVNGDMQVAALHATSIVLQLNKT
jgi:tetratricopeptide (TPR) repeat protein